MYTIIDTHCHVYPPAIAAKATHATAAFFDASSREDGLAETLLQENQEAGICHSVICSVATTPHQVHSVNRFLAETAAMHPDRLTGFGSLHPDSPDVAADWEEAKALGLRGIKIHPDIQGFALNDRRCYPIYELCQGRMPILFHTGDPRYAYSNPPQLKPVLRDFPGLTVIAAHFGAYQNWQYAPELFGYANLYVDCSSSLFGMSRQQAVELIRGFGAERVLFGTDYPMWNPAEEVQKFLALPLSEEERRRILGENAAALLGLEVGV